MKLKLVVSLVGILAASAAFADTKAKSYTLGDLKALVSQKAYEEAVEHLGDLPPSERNAEWLDVAATAAAGFVGQLPVEQIVYGIEAVERAYPQVLTSTKYTKSRGELGLRGYARFLDRASGGGLEQAMRFLDGEPANGGLALGMGKVVLTGVLVEVCGGAVLQAGGRGQGAGGVQGGRPEDGVGVGARAAERLRRGRPRRGRSRMGAGASRSRRSSSSSTGRRRGRSGYVLASTCEILKAKKVLTAKQTRICAGNRDD